MQVKQYNTIFKESEVHLKCNSMLMTFGYPNLMVSLG